MKPLNVRRFWILAILAIVKADIDIDIEPWGDVELTITRSSTKQQPFKCSITDDESFQVGKVQWILEGNVQWEDENPEKSSDESSYESDFKYRPLIEDDGKSMQCKYIPEDGANAVSAEVTLKIVKHLLPMSPFVVPNTYDIGDTAKIELDLQLYPKPEDSDVKWVVENSQTGEKSEITPGQTQGKYNAMPLQNTQGNKYKAILEINDLNESDFTNSLYLSTKEDTEKVKVQMSRAGQPPVVTEPPEEITTVAPDAAGLGAGIWVIIILVILIILVCIGYCIWQKFFRKEDPQPTQDPKDAEKGVYTQAPQKEDPK